MPGPITLEPGQRVELKKPHACGTNDWEIIRLGMDIKLRCAHCGRYVTLLRDVCERRVKKVLQPPPTAVDRNNT
ncbi:MAG: DUF951 domain-containing protein [Armatimonadota bacterium]